MSFSEREGHKKPKYNPLESMDIGLKNAIWTVIYKHINNYYISWGVTGYGDSSYRIQKQKIFGQTFLNKRLAPFPMQENI